MKRQIGRVVIVGGGTAGWLSACVLAARLPDLSITLVEAPDIPTIGVGEGTWPTMRSTLASIGITEAEFLAECDASFKQGSRFDGWVTGEPRDSYLHPFNLPADGPMDALLAAWRSAAPDLPFAAAMTAQAQLCSRDLAPRQRFMPDYAGAANYAYHLDAGKFAALLARHATTRLGVTRIAAHVTGLERIDNRDIAAVRTQEGERIAGELFLDCTGHAALLIGGELGVGWIERSDVSFNDRALALQVPTEPGCAIASQTVGTAHEAGWIWDIALPHRRGIGCVYSSRFMDDTRADEVLRKYVARHLPEANLTALAPRKLAFATGHRAEFWHRNCISIGLSAGFIEPLEASAIVLIELSLRALAENFPASRGAMDIHMKRFNELFRYRWDRIVEFLKLHYVLSQRSEPYWVAQRDPATIPPRLAEQIQLWRDQPPSNWDFPQVDEIFSAASQQYVLYGMGFAPPANCAASPAALARLAEVREQGRALASALPTNRTYFDNLAAASTPVAVMEKTA
ncbi:FAD-dependent oxidoreductase [Altererythrobacter salegens]|uniref:FAD-dependent oxidoreductase n=1 Tax=Croceibacterium salegens TaxID=1737568 RepID=A0A6I4SYX4_9SPHN|nr:tryptophan halogenase family protein [Croceibacterium salegens]MXO59472.1 FAD-dependent oxidoreductase [Croceibacterium salegens]